VRLSMLARLLRLGLAAGGVRLVGVRRVRLVRRVAVSAALSSGARATSFGGVMRLRRVLGVAVGGVRLCQMLLIIAQVQLPSTDS
jgi:hypothetical protein